MTEYWDYFLFILSLILDFEERKESSLQFKAKKLLMNLLISRRSTTIVFLSKYNFNSEEKKMFLMTASLCLLDKREIILSRGRLN